MDENGAGAADNTNRAGSLGASRLRHHSRRYVGIPANWWVWAIAAAGAVAVGAGWLQLATGFLDHERRATRGVLLEVLGIELLGLGLLLARSLKRRLGLPAKLFWATWAVAAVLLNRSPLPPEILAAVGGSGVIAAIAYGAARLALVMLGKVACPRCGVTINRADGACGGCGAVMGTPDREGAPRPVAPEPMLRYDLILIGIVAAVWVFSKLLTDWAYRQEVMHATQSL